MAGLVKEKTRDGVEMIDSTKNFALFLVVYNETKISGKVGKAPFAPFLVSCYCERHVCWVLFVEHAD